MKLAHRNLQFPAKPLITDVAAVVRPSMRYKSLISTKTFIYPFSLIWDRNSQGKLKPFSADWFICVCQRNLNVRAFSGCFWAGRDFHSTVLTVPNWMNGRFIRLRSTTIWLYCFFQAWREQSVQLELRCFGRGYCFEDVYSRNELHRMRFASACEWNNCDACSKLLYPARVKKAFFRFCDKRGPHIQRVACSCYRLRCNICFLRETMLHICGRILHTLLWNRARPSGLSVH